MKLGEKILNLRKKKGLSQEQLGEMVDVTRQTVSNWELGETSPNPEQLKNYPKYFRLALMNCWIIQLRISWRKRLVIPKN